MVVEKENDLITNSLNGGIKPGASSNFAKGESVSAVYNNISEGSELRENPTPDERAEFVILRLEQFIRDGGTLDEGISFKKWQVMAKNEIAIAIAEAEDSQENDEIRNRNILFVSAAAVVTIGFWGAAVSFQKVEDLLAGAICAIAGLMLLGVASGRKASKLYKRLRGKERRKRLAHIKNLNKRIRRLEVALEKEEEAIEKLLKKKRGEHSAEG